ncbi:MAG: tetratricopeptide repeat protein [Planctomycetes bacterium]|nr:tetratricopeptide repeat protein [Planctomycetota bacterium]
MFKYKKRLTVLLITVSVITITAVSAETWQLQKNQKWGKVSEQAQDTYSQRVIQIKQLVNAGKATQAKKAFDEFKKDFPEVAGPDMDAFIKAELLFAKGKFTKAARSYKKFLKDFPESELYEAVLDRQFAIATAFLAGEKKTVLKVFRIKGYAEGARIMENITERAGKAPIATKAALAVAQSYEKRKKFNDAYQQWSSISARWATGSIGKQSLLGMARCKHADYKGPKFDASNLKTARTYYENFKARYSKDAGKIQVNDKLKQIEEQIAHKQFDIGQYYQRTGSEQSANLYYQMVIDNWPNSTAAKMAKAAMQSKQKTQEEKTWKTRFMEKFEKLFLSLPSA